MPTRPSLPRGSARLLTGAALATALLLVSGAPAAAATEDATSSSIGGARLAEHGVVHGGIEPPTVRAKSWVLANVTTGEVLAAKNAHLQRPPASTLKTLTAVALLPQLEKNAVHTATWDDAAVIGSAVGIVPDATYTIDQLFYGLMLPSGNDAAHALATAVGGMKTAKALMTVEALRLQAYDTVVRNTSGLDAKGQLSSAYDLALIAQAGLERADFRRYVSTVTTSFPGKMPKRGKTKRDSFQIYNQNPLLTNYRGALGVKTGYTTLAGRTFVGAAERGGHTLLVSLMGVVEPIGDAAGRLLTWGFDERADLQPVGELVDPVPSGGQTLSPDHDGAGGPPALTPAGPAAAGEAVSSSSGIGLVGGWTVGLLAALAAGMLAVGLFRQRTRARWRVQPGDRTGLFPPL